MNGVLRSYDHNVFPIALGNDLLLEWSRLDSKVLDLIIDPSLFVLNISELSPQPFIIIRKRSHLLEFQASGVHPGSCMANCLAAVPELLEGGEQQEQHPPMNPGTGVESPRSEENPHSPSHDPNQADSRQEDSTEVSPALHPLPEGGHVSELKRG